MRPFCNTLIFFCPAENWKSDSRALMNKTSVSKQCHANCSFNSYLNRTSSSILMFPNNLLVAWSCCRLPEHILTMPFQMARDHSPSGEDILGSLLSTSLHSYHDSHQVINQHSDWLEVPCDVHVLRLIFSSLDPMLITWSHKTFSQPDCRAFPSLNFWYAMLYTSSVKWCRLWPADPFLQTAEW